MGDRILAKQFVDDAGSAFIEVIRRADRPVRLQEIRAVLVDAGVPVDDVDRQWKRLRPLFRTHPHVSKPQPALYEWSPAAHSAKVSLDALVAYAGRRGPAWLIGAFADNVTDNLVRSAIAGPRSQISWTEQREQEKAALVAGIVGYAAQLASAGAAAPDLVSWLLDEAGRRRLTPIGRAGERTLFDGDVHEAVGASNLDAGADVRVVRPGFTWSGGGRPVVVARAVVKLP
ncbi:hypothetical protein I6A84_21570 [Frankia sp. CNm7]|uniref:Uncharacterized protein n=1 Tax=Frankia nepalensis TaxID=1836974 RepID=A0A937RKD1_9ACTN|nr:hypothetical protein [Frankia nepalensis]MBL7496548.1 hypothetical protein [Frankia nepalensis]MBL7508767.1 hypothetical protein [Frankia nepalensis]MBL7520606.1 hypothetical protein [Frankia nepalensis]MBL7627521.1 hypothetical protein [Frankia nepalensis]